jgi:hypothetical protein
MTRSTLKNMIGAIGIPTWCDRVASLDNPTDFAEASAAKMEASDLRRRIAHLDKQLNKLFSAYGLDREFHGVDTLIANMQNAARRSDCLSGIEQLFTHEIPDEDEPGETIDYCPLNWGDSREDYVIRFQLMMNERETVAWMTDDGRVATDETKRTSMASTSRPSFHIALVRKDGK